MYCVMLNLLMLVTWGVAQDYQVLGIGAPCIDVLIRVNDDFVHSLGFKGGSVQTDEFSFEDIMRQAREQRAHFVTGGSSSNTIKGLASFGHRCAMFGKMGRDENSHIYLDSLSRSGVIPLCLSSDGATQLCACLISNDGERTMRCYPGTANDISSEEIPVEIFQNVQLVHVEGYMLYAKDPFYVKTVMRLAKEAGAHVSFDLSSCELVKLKKDQLLELLETYVDIVFANADEVDALFGLNACEGCHALQKLSSIAVVMIGKDGCFVGKDSVISHCPGRFVEVVDTTGAGDLFASGFLHGFLQKVPLLECARLGNLAGSTVCGVMGAEIPPLKWRELQH